MRSSTVTRKLKSAALSVLVCLSLTPAPAQAPAEQQLIDVLTSAGAGLQEKDAACAALKRVGTAQSVPSSPASRRQTVPRRPLRSNPCRRRRAGAHPGARHDGRPDPEGSSVRSAGDGRPGLSPPPDLLCRPRTTARPRRRPGLWGASGARQPRALFAALEKERRARPAGGHPAALIAAAGSEVETDGAIPPPTFCQDHQSLARAHQAAACKGLIVSARPRLELCRNAIVGKKDRNRWPLELARTLDTPGLTGRRALAEAPPRSRRP
jgi:hypothetical protein